MKKTQVKTQQAKTTNSNNKHKQIQQNTIQQYRHKTATDKIKKRTRKHNET